MTELLYFILGIAFAEIVIPVINSIVELICTRFKFSEGKIQVQMMKLQQQIDAMEEGEKTPAIGFDTSCFVEKDDDDDEPEEDE